MRFLIREPTGDEATQNEINRARFSSSFADLGEEPEGGGGLKILGPPYPTLPVIEGLRAENFFTSPTSHPIKRSECVIYRNKESRSNC